MIGHATRLILTALLVVACMLFPFLPGEYDRFAVALSSIPQVFAAAGVFLVPLGVVWLGLEIRSTKKSSDGQGRWRYWLALASLFAVTGVGLFLALAAFVSTGPSIGLAALVISLWLAARLAAKLKTLRDPEVHTFNTAPLYLIVVPVVALISKMALVPRVSEFSRTRAIENSAALLRDIERYHDVNRRYPASLLSVWKDYKPGIVGIEKYHYEPSGDAYNVYFEAVPARFGTREFVVYNKRGEQELTSHATDLLLMTPEQLAASRGYYAVHDVARPHWKRFLFD